MISRVKVKYFKRFADETFELSDHVVLAGPNNSGKTTLLQAIAVWNLGLQKWLAERGTESGSTARERVAIPITRKDFTAIPLREMKLLWTDTSTALGKGELAGRRQGYPRLLTIAVTGQEGAKTWELAMEFRCQSREQLYVKPAAAHMGSPQEATQGLSVVHVPPFSGIGAEETRYDRPYQDLLVGQGKPGDIVRNLLLEVYQQPDKTNWESLSREIEEIFGYRLLAPQYEGRPYILAEYLPGVPRKKGRDGLPALDISSAGSGFLQVLLLLGFFYARPASVLLLDEPDAHLHVILQKQVYDRLRRVAADRKCQLIVATHSEVLVDGTSPEMILSFYRKPHRLLSDVEREQVHEALRRLTATEILLAEQSPGVLYVEGETDFNLLRAWARVLGHRTYAKFFNQAPFWHSNQGRHPREARAHFFALRAVKPGMKGVLLLDGDNRNLPDHEVLAEGLSVARWARYEAESYLIHPSALQRFAAKVSLGDLFVSKGLQFLRDELPGAVLRDPLGDHDYLNRTPASKTLLPGFLKAAQATVPRKDYYLIAEQMNQDEIAAEVQQKLDAIADAFGL